MINYEPKPIKSYYIAYLDILGYREFFHNYPDKTAEFLQMIHTSIQGTLNKITGANQSELAATIASMNIEVKVFSDNILICLEELEAPFERVRMLAFISMVAEIQRGFITQCNLFVRGGITKGLLSINPDYVFGKGLIDAVTIEETTIYPRIEIEPDLINSLRTISLYTQEEIAQAIEVEQCIINKKEISDEERSFYMRISSAIHIEAMLLEIASAMVFPWADGKWVLSYLYCLDINNYISPSTKQLLFEMVKNKFPSDMHFLNTNPTNIDGVLKRHKAIVEERLKEYGKTNDIETGDFKAADLRERILKKYIWVMAYHNMICDFYKKIDYKILTRCNCDSRFLKIQIDVLEDQAGIQTNGDQPNT